MFHWFSPNLYHHRIYNAFFCLKFTDYLPLLSDLNGIKIWNTLSKYYNPAERFFTPTDTIWGIGCDATNIEAVNKIFDIKKREKTNL